MRKQKISIQPGLEAIESVLIREGYEVVHFGENDLDADVTVMSGVDTTWEEIEDAQCMYDGKKEHEMLVINAGEMSPDKVLDLIRNNQC